MNKLGSLNSKSSIILLKGIWNPGLSHILYMTNSDRGAEALVKLKNEKNNNL